MYYNKIYFKMFNYYTYFFSGLDNKCHVVPLSFEDDISQKKRSVATHTSYMSCCMFLRSDNLVSLHFRIASIKWFMNNFSLDVWVIYYFENFYFYNDRLFRILATNRKRRLHLRNLGRGERNDDPKLSWPYRGRVCRRYSQMRYRKYLHFRGTKYLSCYN